MLLSEFVFVFLILQLVHIVLGYKFDKVCVGIMLGRDRKPTESTIKLLNIPNSLIFAS